MQVIKPSARNPSGLYLFDKVPEKVFQGWLSAKSKGRFYNANVKGKYRFKLK